jgi:hypothetical protein
MNYALAVVVRSEYYLLLLTVDSTAKGRKLAPYRSRWYECDPDRARLTFWYIEGWKWQHDWKFFQVTSLLWRKVGPLRRLMLVLTNHS